MLEALWFLSGVVVAGGALLAYRASRDPLHPAVVLAPLFIFFHAFWPIVLNADDALLRFLPEETFEHASLLFLAALTCLYVGLNARAVDATPRHPATVSILAAPLVAKRLRIVAILLGTLAILAYASTFGFSAERFILSYSRGKGGGLAASGYIGEAILLAFPAVLVLALSVAARGRLRPGDIVLALVLISPQLTHAVLGGRRGPMFTTLLVLFIAWFVAQGRRPDLLRSLAILSVAGILVFAAQANRKHVYIGSADSLSFDRTLATIVPDEVQAGNEYVAATVFVETYRASEAYFWGHRYLVTLFIRPIPKQIWPTKYADVGAYWVSNFQEGRLARLTSEGTGLLLPEGASTGAIADGFAEFSYGVLIMFYLLGRGFAAVWWRHRTLGGYWSVLYWLMLALSVYLPTQSFSAWAVRLIFAAGGTWLIWRYGFDTSTHRTRQGDTPAEARQA